VLWGCSTGTQTSPGQPCEGSEQTNMSLRARSGGVWYHPRLCESVNKRVSVRPDAGHASPPDT